jgi:DNA-binding MarR family transcriptional regulator
VQKLGHDADRRLVALSLTPAGQALMDRLGQIADAFQDELRAALGTDAPGLEAGLDRLIEGYANDDAP